MDYLISQVAETEIKLFLPRLLSISEGLYQVGRVSQNLKDDLFSFNINFFRDNQDIPRTDTDWNFVAFDLGGAQLEIHSKKGPKKQAPWKQPLQEREAALLAVTGICLATLALIALRGDTARPAPAIMPAIGPNQA
mgnify:CR=1 FL=1